MNSIQKFNTVDKYNKTMGGVSPLGYGHRFSKVNHTRESPEGHSFGYYTVFLKEQKCGDIKYGRNYYDYQEETLVFLAPNQVVKIANRLPHQPKEWTLMFHPDLLRDTTLGRAMKEYTFFSYEVFEALHLFEEQCRTIIECFRNIQTELNHNIDNYTLRLITSNIELFLNYCTRFYERQFITHRHANSNVLSHFDTILKTISNPTNHKSSVKYCTDQLNLSANYLGDFLKKETDKNAQKHIQLHLIEVAKEKIFEKEKPVSQIAYELGFEYPRFRFDDLRRWKNVTTC